MSIIEQKNAPHSEQHTEQAIRHKNHFSVTTFSAESRKNYTLDAAQGVGSVRATREISLRNVFSGV